MRPKIVFRKYLSKTFLYLLGLFINLVMKDIFDLFESAKEAQFKTQIDKCDPITMHNNAVQQGHIVVTSSFSSTSVFSSIL